jgi:hypothetical protein
MRECQMDFLLFEPNYFGVSRDYQSLNIYEAIYGFFNFKNNN